MVTAPFRSICTITTFCLYVLFFAGPDGQFIGLGDDNGVISDDSPTEFKFEFCGQSVMVIRAPNGCYLKGGQNGLMRAVAEDRASATLWEY